MKHKDWPYIKGDKQIIALTKAYEYNKREADKYKSLCKQKDEKIEELRLIYNQKMIEVRGVLNNYDGYKDTEHPDWYSADGSFQSIPEEGFGGVRVAAFRGSGAETTTPT